MKFVMLFLVLVVLVLLWILLRIILSIFGLCGLLNSWVWILIWLVSLVSVLFFGVEIRIILVLRFFVRWKLICVV